MTIGPVRTSRLPVAGQCCLVGPCGLSLVASPRCFESASTTDVSRHEHPQQKHPLRRLPAERRGKTRRRSPSRFLLEHGAWPLLGETPDHLAVIQPPAAPCLTARRRLRAERRRAAPAGAARGERRSFFGCLHASPLEPSDTSWANEEERVSASFPFAELASPSGTSMPPAFTSSRCLPPWKSRTSALAGTRSGALLPLADGSRCCTFSSRFDDLD